MSGATRILVNPGVLFSPRYWEPRWGRVIQSMALHAPMGADTFVVTSAWRPNDAGKHGSEDAIDGDVLTPVPEEQGAIWAAQVTQDLGWHWDAIWHKVPGGGGWHLHVEDEFMKQRTAWTGGQRARLTLLG